MSFIDDDLDSFFVLKSAGGFADSATLQGASAAVNVIFDAAHLEALGLSSSNPVALAKSTAVARADIGKTLTINSVVYTIRDWQPQDDGLTTLLQLSI